MGLFDKSKDKHRRRQIAREIAELKEKNKEQSKLERAYSMLGKEKEEASKIKRSRYGRSFLGKVESGGSRFLQGISRQRKRQLTFSRNVGRPIISGGKRGRGRPRGTLDPRYAKYGGVYAYRKILSAQLKERKLMAQREASLSPYEQQVLSQAEAQRRAEQIAPENQIIPDVNPRGTPRSIHDEADFFANLVP